MEMADISIPEWATQRGLTPPQHIIAWIIHYMTNQTTYTRKAYDELFSDVPNRVSKLERLAFESILSNGDFSDCLNGIGKIVTGSQLEQFGNFNLDFPLDIMKEIIHSTSNTDCKIKIVLGDENFTVYASEQLLIVIPYTTDLEEPASQLAEMVSLFFDKPRFDIKFEFRVNMNVRNPHQIAAKHALILSKLTPEHFAEKGQPIVGELEREERLTLGFRTSWIRSSSIYYRGILRFFAQFRAGMSNMNRFILQRGDVVEYRNILRHIREHPNRPLVTWNDYRARF